MVSLPPKGFRQLSQPLFDFLSEVPPDGVNRWPAYRKLQQYSQGRGSGFSTLDYRKLRSLGIGSAHLVETLIHFVRFQSMEFSDFFQRHGRGESEDLAEQFSTFVSAAHAQRRDIQPEATWRELPLVFLLREKDGLSRSFCSNSQLIDDLAEAQMIEVGKGLVQRRLRANSNALIAAAENRMQRSLQDFKVHLIDCWRSVPDCVWLAVSGKKPIGGSVILPLTKDAYMRVRAGKLADKDVLSNTDLQIPSRHLLFSVFAPLPGPRYRHLPGIRSALRIRKVLQHIALLISSPCPSKEPVSILSFAGTPENGRGLTQKEFKLVGANLHGFDIPLYELVLPAPEFSPMDFSSPAKTHACLVGFCMRLLNAFD